MQVNSAGFREKQLTFLKMRVELIAWRVEEVGMSPEIRQALSESAMGLIESLLYETQAPDPEKLSLYEQVVREAEERLARNPQFWRDGTETLH